MKTHKMLILLAVFCLLGGLFAAAAETRLTDHRLHLSGSGVGPRYFVDAAGSAVTLTGPYIRQDRDNEKSVAQLAESWRARGANAVRLGICTVVDGVDRVEACGGYTAEGINLFIDRYVDADVQAVLGSDMYLVLTLSDPPASEQISAAIQQALTSSLPLWVELVRHYATEPMIAAFDLWDEPVFDLQNDAEGRELLGSYFIDLVDTLRLYDTEHVLIVSDWNGGRGTAVATQWAGAADQLDSVYHNTAFSIHTGADILSSSYSYYGAWWTATATEWGACLFFGRVSMTGEDTCALMQDNLLKLAQAPMYISAFFDEEIGEAALQTWNEGVRETAVQTEDRRFVYEAETVAPATYLLRQKPVGVYGAAVSFLAGAGDNCAVVDSGQVFPSGLYKLRVRLFGHEDAADLQIGYTTVDGGVVPIGTLSSWQEEATEAVFELATEQKFVDFVLWRDPAADSGDSVAVDRLILRSEGPVVTEKKTAAVVPVSDGAPFPSETQPPAEPEPQGFHLWWGYWAIGGAVLLLVLTFCVLWVLGGKEPEPEQPPEEETQPEPEEETSAQPEEAIQPKEEIPAQPETQPEATPADGKEGTE